ncbi:KRI1-like family C-terminal-domain-containing protein [Pilobolus umbonatus]|nr:KRI1-like family C-terminal-domain-containing protein [Pilobolus umbonatus]
MSTEEFPVLVREREDPSADYQTPELLKQAIKEIELEEEAKAAKQAEDASLSESEYDSDEDEDENAKLLTPAVDSQIFRTLAAIKNKDPRVYKADTSFFTEVDEPVKEEPKVEKKVTLKDYERDIILNNGGFVDEESEIRGGLTHIQEQEALKNAFKLAADEEEEEEDGFLVKKEKSDKEKEKEEEEYKNFILNTLKEDEASKKTFEEWKNIKSNPNVNEEEAFLMDYLLNKGWVDKGANQPAVGDVDKDEDEEYLDNVDCFESKYNFRFEEEGSTQIKTYARDIEGSVRRKDSKRKRERERQKLAKEKKKQEQMELIKQKKNMKMKEIHEKLKEISAITGNSIEGLEHLDLEADYDPSAYDAQMSNVFNEGYYENGEDTEKPVWDDDIETGLEEQTEVKEEEDIMDADYLPGGDKYDGKQTNKRKISQTDLSTMDPTASKKFKDLMEEYYSLNYEDVIGGDVFTRFKYTKTEPEDYGLTAEEILLADDAALNKYIGIRQLAPYRPHNKVEREHQIFKKNFKSKKKDLEKNVKRNLSKLEAEEKKILKEEKKTKKSKKEKKSKREHSDAVKNTEATDVEIKAEKKEKKKKEKREKKNKQ